MRVVVVGAGLLGISSAFYLRRAGCDVTVVERQEGPGLETSFANAGLITPSLSDPWNAPGVFWNLLRWLGREDSPFLLRPRALPKLLGWGVGFVRNSQPERFRNNTVRNLRLGVHNLRLLRTLRAELGLEYASRACGTLKIFRDDHARDEARHAVEFLAEHDVTVGELDAGAVIALEPALAPIADRISGGLYCADDEVGDAYRFTRALAESAGNEGVSFEYETGVTGITATGDGVTVRTNRGDRTCEACVIAAGSYSTPLGASLGLRLPVRPVKGYSVTLEPKEWKGPQVAVVDESLNAGICPLGDDIRVGGTAELTGYDTAVTPSRIDNLIRLFTQVYPEAPVPHRDQCQAWAGLRPVCVDGVPLVGATKIPGVFLNTGHGHLGWTLAVASGQMLADLVCGRPCVLDAGDYAPSRFGL